MSHVYYERHEIPRPPNSHINHSDGRVFIYNSNNPNDRTTIGKATSENMMHPNDTFRLLYPEIWEREYSKYHDPMGIEVSVGLYGLALGSSYKNGLYPVLQDAYGPLYANAIMDYCMYSIKDHSDVTQHYPERMKNEVLFSETLHEDTWYSNLFKYKLTISMHDDFKVQWLKHCIEDGMRKVWLCIDGSNNDCQMQDSLYAEPGKNKSHTQKPIVGYIYAVDSDTGMPVTYFVNPGGMVDSTALQKIITFCVQYHLEVEGAILDRGFCTHDVITVLKDLQVKYVIMTPHDTTGHLKILDECGELIFWNPEYLVNGEDIYGISKEEQIWSTHNDYGFFNLFFYSTQGSIRGSKFNKEVHETRKAAEKIGRSGIRPEFSEKMKKFFDVVDNEDGTFSVSFDFAEWKKALRHQGFYSILTSEDFGPYKTNEIYNLRIASETQYRALKAEEGFDTTRVHTDVSMLSKYAICFAASIMRHTIMNACQKCCLDTNDMIRKMDRIVLLKLDNGSYTAIKDLSGNAQMLFEEFSMNSESFTGIAQDYTRRKTSHVNSQVHVLPEVSTHKERRRGRYPGSKNKKTIEREAAEAAARARGEQMEETQPGKPGRKPGSKDTKPRKKRSDAGKKRGPRKKPA